MRIKMIKMSGELLIEEGNGTGEVRLRDNGGDIIVSPFPFSLVAY